MGNLLAIEEHLEELPSRAPFSNGRDEDRKNNRGQFPWVRVNRWLEAHVGQHWDKVVSEFTHAEWIPKQYRTHTQLTKMVEVNTLMMDGKVCYFTDGQSGDAPAPVNQGRMYRGSHLLYVHPKSKILSRSKVTDGLQGRRMYHDKRVFIPMSSGWEVSAKHIRQYVKQKGIWYQVDGRPYPYGNVFYRKEPRTDLPLLPTDDTISEWELRMKTGMQVTGKYQLDKHELATHFIKNDVEFPKNDKCPICGGFDCKQRHNLAGR